MQDGPKSELFDTVMKEGFFLTLEKHGISLLFFVKLVVLLQVFMNSAGFIKIDTTKVSERTEAYVEVRIFFLQWLLPVSFDVLFVLRQKY